MLNKQVKIMQQYLSTWRILKQYDEDYALDVGIEDCLKSSPLPTQSVSKARLVIQNFIAMLKKHKLDTPFFGQEKNGSLEAILGNLNQTFAGTPLYSNGLEKAGHLLYFIIKDHPFVDGNKRIGCLLFLLYLEKLGITLTKISSDGLAAIALLIAESNPLQKAQIIGLVVNLIKD